MTNIVTTVKSVKSNHVRFSDTSEKDLTENLREVRETVHVAQGFPFISSEKVNGEDNVLFETSSPMNIAFGASKLDGDIGMDMNVLDISANNSNVVGVVDEGAEPPDGGEGGDRGKDKNSKSSQGGRRAG